MSFDALIIIDMQTALVERHPCNEKQVLANIGRLVAVFRSSGVPVVFVRHDGGVGDELELKSPGWEICKELVPIAGERVFDKRFNSAFLQTELHDYLQQQGMKRLVMCGMQTEYCFDVLVEVAYELGYEVAVPRGAVTMFDSSFAKGDDLTRYFEDEIWDGRYACVKDVDEIACELESGGGRCDIEDALARRGAACFANLDRLA